MPKTRSSSGCSLPPAASAARCGLQGRDIDFDSEPMRVLIRRALLEIEKKLIVQGTKTHAVRSVGLDEETAEMLRQHRARAAELRLRRRRRVGHLHRFRRGVRRRAR